MTGELWRQTFQIGKEVTPGTRVAATRRMYYDAQASRLTRVRPPRAHKFATQTRDNVRAFTLGSEEVSGTLQQPLSASEIVELLLMTINGGVTPTGGPEYVWTFTPGTSLDAATMEWYDGARGWEAGGCYGNRLTLSGSVREMNMLTAEILGMNMVQSTITGALSERTPDFIEGWESKIYLDALGDTPGTTQLTGTLVNWNVVLENSLSRHYYADNTQSAQDVVPGEIGISAQLTFRAENAAALTAFNDWDAETLKLVRLDFGNNDLISTGYKYVKVDIPGAWDAVDLGGTDENKRTYQLGLQYVYDPTNAFGLQIIAQNARSAAWV